MESPNGTSSRPSSGLPSSNHPLSGSNQALSTSLESGSYSHGLALDPEIRTWFSRVVLGFSRQHPSLYSQCRRLALHVRGPRPKIDLPTPKPLLNIDVTIAGKHIVAPIEFTIIRRTRPLTAPWLFCILAVAYLIGFAFFSRFQSFLTPPDAFIGCLSTYWLANNQCGLNGEGCGPYDTSSFDFRCPALCEHSALQNPRTVGNQETVFVPLIIGGGDSNRTYRGDSFICPAAIQAGVISSQTGGCGSVSLTFNFTGFLPYSANGLTSISFPTTFPIAFRFGETSGLIKHCTDYRDGALAFNILITCALFILLRPKSIVLYWCLVCIGFWHVALISRPRGTPPALDIAFGTFLPVLFISYALWRVAIRFVLPLFANAPIESCLLYLSGFWVGVLNNLTLEQLPLSRLLVSDLKKRNGAIATLVVGLVVVISLVFNQFRVIRKTGWLPYYLGWYVAGGLVMLVLASLPGLVLRLHHYIVAIMILPLTAFPTRLSALYQGLLLGLFLNGAAGFGLAPILETPETLRQDAAIGTPLPAWVTNSTIYNTSIPLVNQIVQWRPPTDGWDGFALLVDDVERYVGPALNFSLATLNASLPHFFRLAYTSQSNTSDFTKAATLWPNGTWVDPLPGPS